VLALLKRWANELDVGSTEIEIRYDYPQWRHVYVPEEARS